MPSLAIHRRSWCGTFSPRAGYLRIVVAAAFIAAIDEHDAVAGVIATFESTMSADAVDAFADALGQAAIRPSPPFGELLRLVPLWQLWDCMAPSGNGGAGAPRTMSMTGTSLALGSLGSGRLDFPWPASISGRVAERAERAPNLLLASGPFHPPRTSG